MNGREVQRANETLAKKVMKHPLMKDNTAGHPDEKQIATARESTIQSLINQGSVASNKTLFVNSRAAAFSNQTSAIGRSSSITSPSKLN